MNYKLVILLVMGIWLGMVIGISFVEAPLKFQAPNITQVLGLGIGQLVFSALNKIELFFSAILFCWVVICFKSIGTTKVILLGVLISIVVLQSIWLLPILNTRVDALMQGMEVTKSHHHFYYVAMELVKVGLLLYGFIKIYHHE